MSTLEKRFPTIYEQFFSKCSRVASAPHSFFWFGELAGFWGGKTVIQKLPFRFYVGLQPIDQNRFEIEREFYAYNRAKDRFELVHFDDFLIKRLQKLNLKGWRLHFLSEVTIGVSLGAVGALSAALATLIHPHKTARERFKHAWQISRLLQDSKSSGASAWAALADTAYPIVFSSQWPNFSAQTLAELAHLKGDPAWPIDFGLIFSGNTVKGETVLRAIESAKEQLEATNEQGWQTYLAMLNLVTEQGIRTMAGVLSKGATEPEIERLFDLLNQYQNLMHFINISTPEIDEIYGAVHQIANKSENRVGSGAKITGIGKGGEVLVAIPFGKYRDKLADWLLTNDYCLDYASWRDQFETDGVRIEQDITAKHYSPLLKADLVKVKTWYNHSEQAELSEYGKLKAKDFDLLLDQLDNRVYIHGRPVDSKKLPSQKAVVAIVGKLLESGNRQLVNSDIPLETYAHSRYDLHGKVVIPFMKAVNGGKRANFSLKVSGGLYDDYTLTLEANRLKTGLVTRL